MKKKNNKSFAKDGLSPKGNAYNFYSFALKRRVVNEILLGIISKEEAMLKYGIRSRQSINYWLSKYSSLNYRNQKNYGMKESPQEKIKRLEAEVFDLQNDKIILNSVIDWADKEFNTSIRKKLLPQQLKDFKKHRNVKNKEK